MTATPTCTCCGADFRKRAGAWFCRGCRDEWTPAIVAAIKADPDVAGVAREALAELKAENAPIRQAKAARRRAKAEAARAERRAYVWRLS